MNLSDAAQRAWRTFGQNLVIDVGVAVFAVVEPALAGGDVNWTLLGLSALKTALATAASYTHRWLNARKQQLPL